MDFELLILKVAMKRKDLVWKVLVIVLGLLTLAASATSIQAQESTQERVDTLRLQLEELQTKQLDLEQRLKTLEEQSKPENIEKSLAGVGSTRPEELRATKQRQLEIQKSSVQKQLNILAESRVRLEKSLAQAEADAYHQSARGVVVSGNESATTSSKSSSEQGTAPSTEEQRPRKTERKQVRPRRVRN